MDLPSGVKSGLQEAAQVLLGVEGVAICELTSDDVVRHPLVQRLVNAYADRDASRLALPGKKRFDQPQSRLNR